MERGGESGRRKCEEKRKYVRVFIGGIRYIALNEVQKRGQNLRKTCKNRSKPLTTVPETFVLQFLPPANLRKLTRA
jgi:hypothetical protein